LPSLVWPIRDGIYFFLADTRIRYERLEDMSYIDNNCVAG